MAGNALLYHNYCDLDARKGSYTYWVGGAAFPLKDMAAAGWVHMQSAEFDVVCFNCGVRASWEDAPLPRTPWSLHVALSPDCEYLKAKTTREFREVSVVISVCVLWLISCVSEGGSTLRSQSAANYRRHSLREVYGWILYPPKPWRHTSCL